MGRVLACFGAERALGREFGYESVFFAVTCDSWGWNPKGQSFLGESRDKCAEQSAWLQPTITLHVISDIVS
jgi:hypothetical protein